MHESEINKLRQESQSHADNIRGFISKTNPQIDGFKNSYRKYYEYMVTACGIFAGLTQALLASDFQKINTLAALGFIFFVLALITAFLNFREGLTSGAKYTLGLKGTQKISIEFLHEIVRFSRGKITPEKYKLSQEAFEIRSPEMINNPDMAKADEYENSLLKEISENPFSKINVMTGAFLFGLFLVALSVMLPQLICLI